MVEHIPAVRGWKKSKQESNIQTQNIKRQKSEQQASNIRLWKKNIKPQDRIFGLGHTFHYF